MPTALRRSIAHFLLMLATLLSPSPKPVIADEAAPQSAVATGTLAGTVRYQVDVKRPWRYGRHYVRAKSGEFAAALVCLDGPTLKRLAPPKERATIVVDQQELQFTPEVVAIRAGDRVRFTNSDSGTHNVSTASELHPFNVTIAHGEEAVETFPKAGGTRRPIVLGCVFHSQMAAWIYVLDHPHFQLTGADGKFRLANVPPGEYRLEMVHAPGDLRLSRRVEVKAGQTLQLDIAVSPDHTAANP